MLKSDLMQPAPKTCTKLGVESNTILDLRINLDQDCLLVFNIMLTLSSRKSSVNSTCLYNVSAALYFPCLRYADA